MSFRLTATPAPATSLTVNVSWSQTGNVIPSGQATTVRDLQLRNRHDRNNHYRRPNPRTRRNGNAHGDQRQRLHGRYAGHGDHHRERPRPRSVVASSRSPLERLMRARFLGRGCPGAPACRPIAGCEPCPASYGAQSRRGRPGGGRGALSARRDGRGPGRSGRRARRAAHADGAAYPGRPRKLPRVRPGGRAGGPLLPAAAPAKVARP